MTTEQSSFLYSANADFIAELYQRYAQNPGSVDPSWREFFSGLHDDAKSALVETRGASWAPGRDEKVIINGHDVEIKTVAVNRLATTDISKEFALRDSLRAIWLIRIYRLR